MLHANSDCTYLPNNPVVQWDLPVASAAPALGMRLAAEEAELDMSRKGREAELAETVVHMAALDILHPKV